MYTEMERELITRAMEIIQKYENEGVDTTLCSERIITKLENLLTDTDGAANESNIIAITGAANLILEYIENIEDISTEEEELAMDVVKGLKRMYSDNQSNFDNNEDNDINKWRRLVEQENKITSIKAHRVLEMLVDVLGADCTLEDAFNFITDVREENKKDKKKDWNNIRDYVIKDLIEKVTSKYKELVNCSIEYKIDWILQKIEEVEEYEEGSNLIGENINDDVIYVFSEEKYIEYVVRYLQEIKQEILMGTFDEETFGNNRVSNDLSKLKYSWLQYIENEESVVCKGNFFDMLHEVYVIESSDVLTYKLNQLYSYAKFPCEQDYNTELLLNIKPLKKVPVKRKFALLVWKHIVDMEKWSELEIG